MFILRKYLLLIVSLILCAGFVIWKLCGITGNEMLFSFIAIWVFPTSTAFSSGLTLYRNKLNIVPLLLAVSATVIFPLWCFGTYHIAVTVLSVFCAVLGAATSSMFIKMKRWYK